MPDKKSTARTRIWATVVYEESAPPLWLDELAATRIPCFVSPLHDRDINPDNEPKKAHRHVLLMFDGVKTEEQAREVFQLIGGVGCERVQSVRGYSRYLCHLDNPEKAQYEPSEVLQFSGADYLETISLVTDRYKAIGEMIDYCEFNNVVSFAEFLVYCRSYRPDWFRCLCDNSAYVIKEYLKSRVWSARESGGE